MTNETTKGYYNKVLIELKERVDKCDINIVNSLTFFMKEANAYTTGIPTDVEKQVIDEANRFKRDCKCAKLPSWFEK